MRTHQAILRYRAAVLIEQAERLFIRKIKLQYPSKERHKANEDLILMSWELREIQQMTPDTARYAP